MAAAQAEAISKHWRTGSDATSSKTCYEHAGFHASTSFMGPTLINNTILNTGDDGIAIHGRYYLVVAVHTPGPTSHHPLLPCLSAGTSLAAARSVFFKASLLPFMHPRDLWQGGEV